MWLGFELRPSCNALNTAGTEAWRPQPGMYIVSMFYFYCVHSLWRNQSLKAFERLYIFWKSWPTVGKESCESLKLRAVDYPSLAAARRPLQPGDKKAVWHITRQNNSTPEAPERVRVGAQRRIMVE